MKNKTAYLSVYLLTGWVLIVMFWWAIAFINLPLISTELALRLRAVCFGSSPSGLPASYGWIMLIGGPLILLASLLTIWGHELSASFKKIWYSSLFKIFIFAIAIALISEIYWVGSRISNALSLNFPEVILNKLPENYPRTDKPAPDFNLVDQSGKQMTLSDLKGSLTYLTFAFAHCAAICPTLVHNVKETKKQLTDIQTKLAIVTLDPWRDTPGALPGLASEWKLDATSHILSGEIDEVTRVLDAYNIPRVRDEKSGDVTHPGLVYVIDPVGQIVYTLNNASIPMMVDAGQKAMGKIKSAH